jgi:sugar lactone lactonase YvrE
LGILDAIVIFFGSLFGKSVAPPSPELHHTMVNCNGVVTDVETDPNNCGSCGVVCGTGACANSTCISRESRAAASDYYVYDLQWGRTEFNFPIGIAVDGSGNVYVADTYNNRIQKFSSSGVYLTQWGRPGQGDGLFNQPYGVAVDGSGNVYVADTVNHRIQKFDSIGRYIAQWGTSGTTGREPGQFNTPSGIAVDGSGMSMLRIR